MSGTLLVVLLGVACWMLPVGSLVVLSIVGVMLADTPLVPHNLIYLARFVPSGVLALRCLLMLGQRRLPIRWVEMLRAWGPLFVLASLSASYSLAPLLTAQRAASGLFVLLGFGLGIPLFFPRIGDRRQLVRYMTWLIGGAVLYSLFQAGTGAGSDNAEIQRASGVFRNPNTLGLLAMQAAFLFAYWWRRESRRLHRALMLAPVLGVATATLISGSRASVLGLLVGFLVLAGVTVQIERRAFRRAFGIAVVLVATLFVTELFFPEYLAGALRTETSSRTVLWERGLKIGMEQPLLGAGFGAGDILFARDIENLRRMGIFLSGSHSSPLRLFVDLGIVGVLLVTFAFVRILGHSRKYFARFEDRKLGGTLFALVAASLVNSVFEGWMFGFGSASAVPFWLCLALLSHEADVVRYNDRLARRQVLQASAGSRLAALRGSADYGAGSQAASS